MVHSKTVGVVALLVLILGIVSLSVLKNASSTPGIVVREPRVRGYNAVPQPREPAPLVSEAPPAATDTSRAAPSGSSLTARTGPEAPLINAPLPTPEVVIQVAGAVKRPGVYHLAAGARNDDAVKAAGGLGADANAASVNLAAHAVDGSQIYIKTRKQQPSGGAGEDAAGIVPSTSGSTASGGAKSSPSSRGTAANARKGGTATKPAKLKDPSEGKVNLNTASAEDLQRISGIGPSMAEKIIAYRQENHGFQSVEDLMQVSGVGAKKFAKWSPFLKIH